MSRCGQCKNYSVLNKPRKIKDDIQVYGFCFKDFRENYGNMYPVYIPDGGGCKDFIKRSDKREEYEYEISQEFKCECCKKNLLGKIKRLLS